MTLRGIIHKKICIRFDETNWYQKLFFFYKLFAVFAIFLAIAQPEIAIKLTAYKSFIIPKLFIVWNLIIFIQEIIQFFLRIKIVTEKNVKRVVKAALPNKPKTEKKENLEWVPVDDILYVLFKYRWRSNLWFQKEIWKNNKLYKKLGDILEKRGIVKRWEKNARVINEELEEQEIYTKLLSPTIERVSENSYSYNTV